MRNILYLASAIVAGLVALPAVADTYLVTKTADTLDGVCNSDCSLREAVQIANQHRGSDIIRLPAGTYRLSIPNLPGEDDQLDEDANQLGDLDINDRLAIYGAEAATTVIDAGGIDRIFEVFPGIVFKTYDLTVTNGRSTEWGGAIFNAGVATLRDTVISNSRAASGFNNNRGGGIANTGTVMFEHCQIAYNRVQNGESGQGIGGGIYNSGTIYFRRSEILGNTASDDNDDGNGAGLYNTGTAIIEQSLVTANYLYSYNSRNNAGIFNSGRLDMSNSTVSGNLSTEQNGGAVGNVGNGNMRLFFVTIADNMGGGLRNTATLSLSGTVVAGNASLTFSGDEPNYQSGSNCVTSGSYSSQNSLLGLDGNCTAQLYVDNSTVFSSLLYPLAQSGGAWPTHKPRRGSAIVDAVSPFTQTGICPPVDQRSAPRPPNDDGRRGLYCDIGAYELMQ